MGPTGLLEAGRANVKDMMDWTEEASFS